MAHQPKVFSDQTSKNIDEETSRIISENYERTKTILEENMDKIAYDGASTDKIRDHRQ